MKIISNLLKHTKKSEFINYLINNIEIVNIFLFSALLSIIRITLIPMDSITDGYSWFALKYLYILKGEPFPQNIIFYHTSGWKNRILYPLISSIISYTLHIPLIISLILISSLSYLFTIYYAYYIFTDIYNMSDHQVNLSITIFTTVSSLVYIISNFGTDSLGLCLFLASFYYFKKNNMKNFIVFSLLSTLTREFYIVPISFILFMKINEIIINKINKNKILLIIYIIVIYLISILFSLFYLFLTYNNIIPNSPTLVLFLKIIINPFNFQNYLQIPITFKLYKHNSWLLLAQSFFLFFFSILLSIFYLIFKYKINYLTYIKTIKDNSEKWWFMYVISVIIIQYPYVFDRYLLPILIPLVAVLIHSINFKSKMLNIQKIDYYIISLISWSITFIRIFFNYWPSEL